MTVLEVWMLVMINGIDTSMGLLFFGRMKMSGLLQKLI